MKIVNDDKTLPPQTSRSGKNSCYLYCGALNRRSNYGICLFSIDAYGNGRLREDSDCYAALNKGSCEALAFQKQEQEAGYALFYKERGPVVVPNARPMAKESSNGLGWRARKQPISKPAPVEATKPAAKSPKPKESSIFGVPTSGLNEAVNEAVIADKKAHKKKGLSILERAKRMAGIK